MLSNLFLSFVFIASDPASLTGPIAPLSVDQVITRMVEMDEMRRAELHNYTSVRHYSAGNQRLNKHAEMTVRMTYVSPDAKSCEVISETGAKVIRGKVLKKVIDAEVEAAAEANGKRSRIIPENYDFQLLGQEEVNGRSSYIFQITPKTSNKFLVQGRIWVDAEDFAVARFEGGPAKSPSFWITETVVRHEYQKHGQFWLPRSNFSQSKVRIFGKSELKIDYLDYELNVAPSETGTKP